MVGLGRNLQSVTNLVARFWLGTDRVSHMVFAPNQRADTRFGAKCRSEASSAVKAFDEAFSAGTMTPEILGGGRGTLAPLMASVTLPHWA